jgi:hypothetical protein
MPPPPPLPLPLLLLLRATPTDRCLLARQAIFSRAQRAPNRAFSSAARRPSRVGGQCILTKSNGSYGVNFRRYHSRLASNCQCSSRSASRRCTPAHGFPGLTHRRGSRRCCCCSCCCCCGAGVGSGHAYVRKCSIGATGQSSWPPLRGATTCRGGVGLCAEISAADSRPVVRRLTDARRSVAPSEARKRVDRSASIVDGVCRHSIQWRRLRRWPSVVNVVRSLNDRRRNAWSSAARYPICTRRERTSARRLNSSFSCGRPSKHLSTQYVS